MPPWASMLALSWMQFNCMQSRALAKITEIWGNKRWVNCGPKQMPVPETTSHRLLRRSLSVNCDTRQKVRWGWVWGKVIQNTEIHTCEQQQCVGLIRSALHRKLFFECWRKKKHYSKQEEFGFSKPNPDPVHFGPTIQLITISLSLPWSCHSWLTIGKTVQCSQPLILQDLFLGVYLQKMLLMIWICCLRFGFSVDP